MNPPVARASIIENRQMANNQTILPDSWLVPTGYHNQSRTYYDGKSICLRVNHLESNKQDSNKLDLNKLDLNEQESLVLMAMIGVQKFRQTLTDSFQYMACR